MIASTEPQAPLDDDALAGLVLGILNAHSAAPLMRPVNPVSRSPLVAAWGASRR